MRLKSDSSSLYSVSRRIDYIASITGRCGIILGMKAGPTALISGHDRIFVLVRYLLENIYTTDLSITDLETLSQCLGAIVMAKRLSHIENAIDIALYTLKLKSSVCHNTSTSLHGSVVSGAVFEVTRSRPAAEIMIDMIKAEDHPTTSTETHEEYKIHGPY